MAWYSEEAPSILWVYHGYAYQYLLALVALVSWWIENFRRTACLTFSAFHDWSIEQSVSVHTFLGQLQQDAGDYEQNTPQYTYARNETVFFPENWTDFVFQKLPEEIQSKIVYFCSVINEYSLHSRDVHSTPSWHKWADFEYRPWCLAIVVCTPPGSLSQETVFHNPDSFHLAYRLKSAFKLRNMERKCGKKCSYQKCNYANVDCSLSSFTAQANTL